MILLSVAILLGDAPRPCTAFGREDTRQIRECLREDARGFLVLPGVIPTLEFKEGLATVSSEGVFLYVDRQGRTARMLSVENGPDYFIEGLARTVENGKVGFIDHSLRRVIRPRWDFASPFSRGLAVVCDGCRMVRHSEEELLEGGRWGYIDRKGEIVVPVKYSHQDLPTQDEVRRPARHP